MIENIFTFNGADAQWDLCYSYYDVTFIKDFGGIKKGSKFSSVYVDYIEGFMDCDSDSENIEVKIELTAK